MAKHVKTVDSKKDMCCLLFPFLEISFSLQKEESFQNQTRTKEENLDQVLTQRTAIFGPSFDSTIYLFVYIYVL